MQERKIEHALRTIVLKYDEGKPETDYEQSLLKSYVELHDRALALQPRMGKLLYEYGEHETAIGYAMKKLKRVADSADAFLAEAKVITQHREHHESVNDLYNRMFDFGAVIRDFHKEVVEPVCDESDRLWDEAQELEKNTDKFWEDYNDHHNKASDSLYKEFDKYSLDLCSYDDDLQDFLGVEQKLNNFFEKRDATVDVYDDFTKAVNRAYGSIEEVKRLTSLFFDEDGLLDRTLSESYATGKGDAAGKPLYLISPAEKSVADFGKNYGLIAGRDKHTLILSVEMDIVMKGDVQHLQDFVAHLQHYPRMIGKWIFGITVQFLNHDGIEMQDDDWKGHGPPVKWFQKMSSLPCCIFFLQDAEARFYFLAGDLLAENKLGDGGDGYVTAEGKQIDELCQRVFNVCWFFMLFCHNTGFDPSPAIKQLIDELQMPITIEQVKEQYEKDIKNGIELRRVAK